MMIDATFSQHGNNADNACLISISGLVSRSPLVVEKRDRQTRILNDQSEHRIYPPKSSGI